MSFDRRTGKPIAVSVIKMEAGAASFEILSENRVSGTVVSEAKVTKSRMVNIKWVFCVVVVVHLFCL